MELVYFILMPLTVLCVYIKLYGNINDKKTRGKKFVMKSPGFLIWVLSLSTGVAGFFLSEAIKLGVKGRFFYVLFGIFSFLLIKTMRVFLRVVIVYKDHMVYRGILGIKTTIPFECIRIIKGTFFNPHSGRYMPEHGYIKIKSKKKNICMYLKEEDYEWFMRRMRRKGVTTKWR